jgi:hypothetical protein
MKRLPVVRLSKEPSKIYTVINSKDIYLMNELGGMDNVACFLDKEFIIVLCYNRQIEYVSCSIHGMDGDEVSSMSLQSTHNIKEVLGKRGLKLKGETMANRLSAMIYETLCV